MKPRPLRSCRLQRCRLAREEILTAAGNIRHAGIKTVVLQSGEEDNLDSSWLRQVIEEIKNDFDMAVTLSNLPFGFEPDETWLPVKRVLEKPVKPEVLLNAISEHIRKA